MWGESWKLLSENEYGAVWDRFDAHFNFKPSWSERVVPAIQEPPPCVVFDISGEWADALNGLFELALTSAGGPGDSLYFLDWQHEAYRIDPLATDALPIFPDGDYYSLLAEDFSFGTFGHPWQQSLCVFGADLLTALPDAIYGSLPVLRVRLFAEDWTHDQIEAAIAADGDHLNLVPLLIGLDAKDKTWAARLCIALASHQDPSVRGNALVGLGHLARREAEFDLDALANVLARGLDDPNHSVRTHAESAHALIARFAGLVLMESPGGAAWFGRT